MLIALFTIFILGGGGGLIGDIKEVRKDVKAVMEKSDERDAALITLKQMEKLTNQRDKNLKKYLKQFLATVSDHEYKISDLDQLWDEYRGTRSNFNREFIELRFELKEHISREDWARVFSPD
jgi:hypothetical protein